MKRETRTAIAAGVQGPRYRIPARHTRRGTVLLIVIVLLGILLLAGIAFLTFASQENVSGEYFADSAKRTEADVNAMFEFALSQLIVGPEDTNTRSALYGRRHALVSNMVGNDSAVYSSTGIHLGQMPTGAQFVDMNRDGLPDASQELFNYNYSAAANGGTLPTVPTDPLPDVDYTYPDINNLYLAYAGLGMASGGADLDVRIPSFHPVQYFRGGIASPTPGQYVGDWARNSGYARKLFRPHPLHVNVPSGTPRYWGPDGAWGLAGVDDDGNGTVDDITEAGWPGTDDFPFLVDLDGDGTYNEVGVWSSLGNTTWELDADNDGDGVREGVWMDLGYPVQTLGDGRTFVPMFSFTVYDADGLIPLNAGGNVAGDTVFSRPFGGGAFISKSNMALSRSEINPIWGLTADPQSSTYISPSDVNAALEQYRVFYGINPSGDPPITRTELANMDFLFLQWGRAQFARNPAGQFVRPGLGTYSPSFFITGKWGEPAALAAGVNSLLSSFNPTLFPRPGVSGVDDDGDLTFGRSYTMSHPQNALQNGLAMPSFLHPLDLAGNGQYLITGSAGRIQSPHGLAMDPTNPIRFPCYDSGFQDPGNFASSGNLYPSYRDAGVPAGTLCPALVTYGTMDEADETTYEPGLTSPYDAVFSLEEMFALHATNSDFDRAATSSRIRDLMPFNMRDNALATRIRQQFTVSGFDRNQLGFLNSALRRPWEFNADIDSDGAFEFPPAMPYTSFPVSTLSVNDPIRWPVRLALRSELDSAPAQLDELKPQGRLEMNGLLSHWTTGTSTGAWDDPTRRPIYRPLTPHPTTLPATAISGNNAFFGPDGQPGMAGVDDDLNGHIDDLGELGLMPSDDVVPTASPMAQEFWARRDRQLLARDIYVLLYLLCQGQDGVPLNLGANATTEAMARDMARFAVNYVDNLDPDDVITRFEYDLNLTDGWDLDDNPYTVGDGGAMRREVFGQEAVQLTINELLAVQARQSTVNHPATRHDDLAGHHYFAYIELLNASPFNVSLNNGSWRIRRITDDAAVERRLYLLNGSGTIAPGQTFVIGTRSELETGGHSSDLRVDYDLDGSYNLIAPRRAVDPNPMGTDPTLPPASDLDLFHSSHAGRFDLRDGNNAPLPAGAFLNTQNPREVQLVLERRVHLTRTPPSPAGSDDPDNPWVIVDSMLFQQILPFELRSGDTETTIRTVTPGRFLLPTMRSFERGEPLDQFTELSNNAYNPGTLGQPNLLPANTLGFGNRNSNAPAPPNGFKFWHPLFDRHYASPVDALSITLSGPPRMEGLPSVVGPGYRAAIQLRMLESLPMARPPGTLEPNYFRLGAYTKFLRPDDPSTAVPEQDNRWYRLLGLLTVPTRTHLGLSEAGLLQVNRTPGVMNLNTIRHRAALAALVDDADNPNTLVVEGHLHPLFGAFDATGVQLSDRFDSARNWWQQFIAARDRQDPVTGAYLPGLPHSRPFRSLSFVEAGNESLEHTILRAMPLANEDANGNGVLDPMEDTIRVNGRLDNLQLFEARHQSDMTTAANNVDMYTRNRLLRKVYNNSTTRSNTFIVFVSVGFFDARTAGTDTYVGNLLDGTTVHRGFFVIDRSDAERAFNTSTGQFDYRPFVKYRRLIE